MTCRACKLRQVAERKPSPVEDPELVAIMEPIRRRHAGLCSECRVVASIASIDQSCEKIARGERSA